MWSRRKFIESSILSQLAISTGLLSQFYACVDKEIAATAVAPELQRVLQAAMDEIIPAGDGMPAASEAGGLNYLMNLFIQIPHQAKELSQGLAKLNVLSLNKFSKKFDALSASDKINLLELTEKDEAAFFNQLRNFTYESYYLSPKVWELIGYEPHPTLSSGPLMEAFDVTLLSRVKTLKSFYKLI